MRLVFIKFSLIILLLCILTFANSCKDVDRCLAIAKTVIEYPEVILRYAQDSTYSTEIIKFSFGENNDSTKVFIEKIKMNFSGCNYYIKSDFVSLNIYDGYYNTKVDTRRIVIACDKPFRKIEFLFTRFDKDSPWLWDAIGNVEYE